MSLRRLWMISVATRSVIFTKTFPVIEVKSRKLGFQFSPLFGAPNDEEDFINSLFTVLGIDNLLLQRDRFSTDDLGFFSVENFGEKFSSWFNCNVTNQLPVVEVLFKETKMWPILVIEHNGILFCALPLIETPARQVIDHISISTAFGALQALIKHFSNDSRVSGLEEFVSNVMPFGTFLGKSLGCYIEMPTIATRKAEDSVITVKVNETISRGTAEKETVYGTITIENNQNASEKGRLNVNLKDVDDLSIVLSPSCTRAGDRVHVFLTDHRLTKHIHYKVENQTGELASFLSYSFKISRVQSGQFKVDLTIKCTSSCKFAFFNVQFKQSFANGTAKINNSNVDWGQLHLEKSVGLFWILGSKFPKSGQVQIGLEVSAPDIAELADAVCNFKVENFSFKLRLPKDSISINEHVIPSPRLFTEHQLSSAEYKLLPNMER